MSKYRAIRTGRYPSKKEAKRAQELAILFGAGLIGGLREQIRYELIPAQDGEKPIHYVADFQYTEDGVLVVEDCKGFRTPEYVMKRKLMLWRYGIRIRET